MYAIVDKSRRSKTPPLPPRASSGVSLAFPPLDVDGASGADDVGGADGTGGGSTIVASCNGGTGVAGCGGSCADDGAVPLWAPIELWYEMLRWLSRGDWELERQ